jgi:hypothetical protein
MRKLPVPTLAQRALELRTYRLEGAQVRIQRRQLRYDFSISPGYLGRLYACALILNQDGRFPELRVLNPDLRDLAGGRRPPHIYPSKGPGTKLCLWWPKAREWSPYMSFAETYIPWTAEWLWHFENWLATGEWEGGGVHPEPAPKRWSRRGTDRTLERIPARPKA